MAIINDTTDNKISADWVLQVLYGMAKAYESPDVHCGNCVHHGRYSGPVGSVQCLKKGENVFLSNAQECRDFEKSPYKEEMPLQCAVECDKMNAEHPKTLTDENIRAINAVLAKDQRVELIPTERGVRVIHVQRKEIKGDTAARR